MERGHRDITHCTHVNAYFIDMDEGTYSEQYERIMKSPCPPSFVVKSKNGYHVYFLAPKEPKETFDAIQSSLIEYYNADRQCADISRVLRLPGFYHFKDPKDPFKIEIIESNPSILYTSEDMIEIFNVDIEKKKVADTPKKPKKHETPTTFWEHVAHIDPKTALTVLSGTEYIKNEVMEFKPRPNGGEYIIVNGQMANAWLDEQGLIGSGAGGGPGIYNWLKFYGHSASQIANIVRSVLSHLIPMEVLEGEVVTMTSLQSSTGQSIELKAKTETENIKTTQELGDSFIVRHNGNLYFCLDDQTVYIYDTEKKYHVGYTPMRIEKYVNNFIIDIMEYKKSVTKTLRNEVIYQIKYRAPEIRFSDEAYISLEDGLLNLNTLELSEHTPDIFCTMYLPITFEGLKKSKSPVHDVFVNEIMVTKENPNIVDEDLKEKYLQIMGYFLSPKNRPHAFIFFIGEGRNGKGTGANLLKEILGKEFCSSLTLDKLSNSEHASEGLVGKRLNVCGEDESMYIKNDILKTLASDDSITINPKFIGVFDYVPIAKYLLMSNDNPRFSNIDNAMKRRIHIIPHNREVLEHDLDWDLPGKLLAEKAGVIWKFAQAYQRLVANNYSFHTSKQSDEALKNLEKEVSSVIDWARESLIVSEHDFFAATDLYRIYKVWCDDSGRKPVSKQRWGKDFVKELKVSSEVRRVEGVSLRGYSVSLVNIDG